MQRVHALDGLRGLAAVTVLLHHSLLLVPALAAPYYSGEPSQFGTVEWWMVHTPLHALWEGKAGVYIFFVLSGFVLTLPSLRSGGYEWRSYYPSRLLRLYLPTWAAVVFAVATFYLVPRVASVQSLWLQDRPVAVTPIALIRDITLVGGSGGLASPLWSLTWEILFSLMLPFGLWAAATIRRLHLPLAVLAVLISTVGGILGESMLLYPPMFLVGILIAMRRESISHVAARVSPAGWWFVLAGALVSVTSRWITMGLGAPQVVLASTEGIMLIGAAAFVIMTLEWSRLRGLLEIKPFVILGTLSFSLYLVHEPLVIAAGFTLPESPAVAILIAILATIVVTPIFYRFIELPSHHAAKAVSRRLSRRVRISESTGVTSGPGPACSPTPGSQLPPFDGN